jgi:hypothetical protein
MDFDFEALLSMIHYCASSPSGSSAATFSCLFRQQHGPQQIAEAQMLHTSYLPLHALAKQKKAENRKQQERHPEEHAPENGRTFPSEAERGTQKP